MTDPLSRLLADPPGYPVAGALPSVVAAVRERGCAVVQAPPGTGKTTLVPPALAAEVDGRVVVTQPRRIAARAAARRLASLLGEDVGGTVGYTVRGERRASRATRIEVVTTGVLLRRLQRDPELPGVAAVVLDEVHERHIDGDLALAFCADVRANLRDDLGLVAMSATVEAERTAALLGTEPAPVVEVQAALHPLTVHWSPPSGRVARTDERGITWAFLDHVAAVTRRAYAQQPGDVLVFVPGVREIDAVVGRLGGLDADVLPLHGRLPAAAQDRALTAGPRRRVVVSTAVAESSLTVPGVRVVVDAGFARHPRTDHRRGLAGLVTVGVSRAAADQRAGRAAREAPGAVYRCWSEADHARLPAHPAPEIATADLADLALELACWGSADGAGLGLLDPPPPAAMQAAREVLAALGAVTPDGAVTPRGRAIAALGVDPRLGRALFDGGGVVGARRAAEVVALLAEDVRAPNGDLVAALRDVRRGGDRADGWRRQVERLTGASADVLAGASGVGAPLSDDLAVGLVVALAHPDRIARRRRADADTYLMASGTAARAGGMGGLEWLAVADAEWAPGRGDATVRSAAPLDEDLARLAGAALLRAGDSVTWEGGRVVARRGEWLGAIELSSTPVAADDPHLVRAAVRAGLARDGLGVLGWSPGATALRARLAFLHGALGDPWPDVGDAALLARLDDWLGPDLDRVRTNRDLARVDVLVALRRLLPWPAAARLDELAPERITVPSGSAIRVDYTGARPVLAVKLQETFGWTATPTLAGGAVPLVLHLLSPAGRPAAVTADLASFWADGYRQVRADLRGRYPKHSWPEDPRTERAHRGTSRNRR